MTATIHRHPAGLTWVQSGGLQRAAHALHDSERVWIVDPFEDEAALDAAAALGRPAAVLQLLDRHNRDCAAVARRLGVPHLTVPTAVPDSPFRAVAVIRRRVWREAALWWEARGTLVVAEALGTAPLFALGRALGVHPALRLTPPRGSLGEIAPSLVLVGHGAPVQDDAPAAVTEALAGARSDVPRLLARLPSVLRGH